MNKMDSRAGKRMSFVALVASTMLAILVNGTVSADEFDNALAGEITSIVCPFKHELEYDVGRIKCGLINVPENREKADSRTIHCCLPT